MDLELNLAEHRIRFDVGMKFLIQFYTLLTISDVTDPVMFHFLKEW